MAGEETEASRWFMQQLLAMAPGTRNGGIYVNVKSYHNTGNANLRQWPNDYSVRDAEDRRGPWRTKAAGYDWTFPEAQATVPDYRRISMYGQRLQAAWLTRDPRVSGWREALGKADTGGGPPVGLDFRHHYTRIPDDRHLWHWHFSEDREQVESLKNKQALLSVLSGETLAQWLDREEDDMSAEDVKAIKDHIVWEFTKLYGRNPAGGDPTLRLLTDRVEFVMSRVEAAAASDQTRNSAMLAAIVALTDAVRERGGNADADLIVAKIDEQGARTSKTVTDLQAEVSRLRQDLASTEAERDNLRAQLTPTPGVEHAPSRPGD